MSDAIPDTTEPQRGLLMDRSEPRAKQAGTMNCIVRHPRSLPVAALNTP
jgi:hypothetical protein